eukprot:m.8082 g.8082  ORF g.8082 m.8082 type:complete len:625 (-) comp4023_c0_seq2:18-1892(-)
MSYPSKPSAPPAGTPAAPAAPPLDRTLVEEAIRTKIPGWTARLQAVFKAPVVLALDFNELTRTCTTPADRLKVVSPLLKGVDRLAGLVAEPPAVEQFVRAVEECLKDGGVIHEVLGRMPSLRIAFANFPGGGPGAKRLEFANSQLTYTGDFGLGQKGVLNQAEIESFFEIAFFAKERVLVGHCQATTLPEIHNRLRQATKRPDFAFMFDIPHILSGVSVPEKRLDTARLLISQTGITRKLDTAGKMAEQGINSMAAVLEASLTGENEQFKQNQGPIQREVYTSPQVLQPLVRAIETTCTVPEVAAAFAQAVRGVCFQNLPPKSPRTLALRQELEVPCDLLPKADGEVPYRQCWLVYAAPFEDGKSAVFTERECLEVLEAYFRGREKALVFGFLGTDLVKARSIVQANTTPRVEIEILWSTFFHPGIEIGAGRLEVAELVCASNSSLLLTPFVTAVDSLVKTTPAINVQAMLAARVAQVTIQSQIGKSAKPSLTWGQVVGPPGINGEPGAAVLVYNCAIDRAHRGFLAEHEVKAALRKLLGLQTPPEETGAAALVRFFLARDSAGVLLWLTSPKLTRDLVLNLPLLRLERRRLSLRDLEATQRSSLGRWALARKRKNDDRLTPLL